MFIRKREAVYTRPEAFGCTVYVSSRDDVFWLNKLQAKFLFDCTTSWRPIVADEQTIAVQLAKLGIAEISQDGKKIKPIEEAYSGSHIIGFDSMPTVDKPILVNCFSTSWCPLKCVYCHADDLMTESIRSSESPDDVRAVAAMAKQVPALVYVVTGGDPLTSPDQACELSDLLPRTSGLVIDTSGVGSLSNLERLLNVRKSHLRVSIDSIDPRINQITRPINKLLKDRFQWDGRSSLDYAKDAIKCGYSLAAGVTVQTVVSTRNDTYQLLAEMRDWLISFGVRNWVLHIAIPAGAALRFSQRTPSELQKIVASDIPKKKRIEIVPDFQLVEKALARLITETIQKKMHIDIRLTNAAADPNGVLLIDSKGNLVTQGNGKDPRTKTVIVPKGTTVKNMNEIWIQATQIGHTKRYSNYSSALNKALEALKSRNV